MGAKLNVFAQDSNFSASEEACLQIPGEDMSKAVSCDSGATCLKPGIQPGTNWYGLDVVVLRKHSAGSVFALSGWRFVMDQVLVSAQQAYMHWFHNGVDGAFVSPEHEATIMFGECMNMSVGNAKMTVCYHGPC